MKRIALVAAVFALAACAKSDEAAVDTAAMAPAPAAMDTGMQMMDTAAMMTDTSMMDTTKK
jgi:hypothetical protein